jgi:hypothetical protein
MNGSAVQDISIDEFGTYPFAFTTNDALAAYNSGTGALKSTDRHGLTAFATWAPGEKKVKVTLDSGNDFLGQIKQYDVTVLCDGQTMATQAFNQLHGGSVEGVMTLPTFGSGIYTVFVKATASGALISTTQSSPFVYVQPSWLGNTLGVDQTVPAPYWDPITTDQSAGLDLTVVHRKYSLGGGFGLPTQITSLGKTMLARPVLLEVEQNGSVLPLTGQSVQVTSAAPNQASWQGRAVAGSQVQIDVKGQLDYDGMTLLTLKLTPTGGPVNLSAIRLTTTMTGSTATYVQAAKDQPFYWYTWAVRVPTATGEFNNNLSATPRPLTTNNIFSTVFSDEDRGLQIFHENMAGWQINESKPWQRYIREADGSVSYQCLLANSAFTLSAPTEITIGIMATPVKRLPDDWRLASVGAYGGDRTPGARWQFHFQFPDDVTWKNFHLLPVNASAYKSKYVDPVRRSNTKLLPFVNAHVLLADNPATYNEVASLLPEVLNTDGWSGSPSTGMADYWSWAMNWLLTNPQTPDLVDGLYIDESYDYLQNASLLTGAGYIKPDGTHGVGQHLLGGREKYTRLAKILMASGKTPNLWIHSTATMYPQMWSHAMVLYDGEISATGWYSASDSPASADHFDTWNANNSLIDPTRAGRGSWLLGISAARKFGFIPSMWRGIQGGGPAYATKQRRAECIYQMADILQQDQESDWWTTKNVFGVGTAGVTFSNFVNQTELAASDPNVKVSYYKNGNALLAYVANFNNTDWTGNLTANLQGLSASGLIAHDAESGVALGSSNGFGLSVPRHDCRVLRLDLN